LKRLVTIIIIVFTIFGLLIPANRYFYGNWNPLEPPEKIYYSNRIYYKSETLPKTFVGYDKPSYPLYSLNWIFGKKIYSEHPRGKYVPTVIYLYIGNSSYQTYSLSGGP